MWLQKATASILEGALERSSVHAARWAAQLSRATVVDTRPGLSCPTCARALRRVVVAGIETDVCDEHGTFYDKDELPLIAERLAAGQSIAAVPSRLAAGAASVAVLATAVGTSASLDDEQRQRSAVDVIETGVEGVELLSYAAEAGGVVVEAVGVMAEVSLAILGGILEGIGGL